MTVDPEDRASLGAAQTQLVVALTAGGTPPPGFDLDRVAATAGALARKRSRHVARAWPALVGMLGDEYVATFTAWARRNPKPSVGGATADGLLFSQDCVPWPSMDYWARVERATAMVTYRIRDTEAHRRRMPAIVIRGTGAGGIMTVIGWGRRRRRISGFRLGSLAYPDE